MRLLGYFVLLCLLVAALRMAALALLLGWSIALLALLWTHPVEAVAFFAFAGFCAALNANPLAVIVAVTVLVSLGMIMKSREKG